ncbi:MAG TPA: hypothetical protein VK537_02890 [Galbitalea sp.]|nr:hypothetical protein [Galbitalea sp.]
MDAAQRGVIETPTEAESMLLPEPTWFITTEGEWSQMSGWGTGFPGVPAHKPESDVADDSGTEADSADAASAAE